MTAPAPIGVRRRTGPQITAATPEASVWVSANAGTGKTGVLVDRISRLLLAGVAPDRILCLTFTKAAAAEMANRLSALLSRWSAMPDASLAAELAALGEGPVDADLMTRARQLFAATLEAPEGLRIRTIHSFCESLLGRFPLEARISPDFRVMDERDQREMQTEARDRMLGETEARGTPVADALRALAGLVDEDGFAKLMAELDANRARFRAALAAHGGADGLIRALEAALGIVPGTTPDGVRRDACTLDAAAVADLNRLADAWERGSKTHQSGAAVLRAYLAAEVETRMADWRAGFADLFVTRTGAVRAESKLVSKGAAEADPGALDIARDWAARTAETLERLRAFEVAAATAALIRVGARLSAAYERIKERRGRLDYDDLIERASALLASPGGVGWVHYKLDGGIEHVLVDEAQDTSPEQWRVIEQVASDFFAGESRYEETHDRPRTVFAVGDEKQSIYSFQGADPAMFGTVKARFAARVSAVERLWRPVDLAESFRSAPAVLNVVDKVFEDPRALAGVSFDGRRIRHDSARRGQAGRVELWPKEEPRDDDAEDDPWDVPVDRIAADSPAGRTARRIADTVAGWLRTGEPLPAQGRAVRPGDILILVQKRKGFAEMLVAALKERHVPVSGRDRMVLPDQLAVQDLIALGRLTLLAEDDLTTATVLKGPLIGLDEDALFALAHGRTGTLLAALREVRERAPAFGDAWARIAEWRRRADFMPPFEFFSEVLGADGGRRAILAELGPDAADPLDEFLSAALDYERDHVPSMEGFLHWLETGAAEIKRDLEQGRNEVRVMTVHGAKGLQSEIVFLADACTVPAPQSESRIRWFADGDLPVWPAHKDNETEALGALKERMRTRTLDEYQRLLYVAMTRAKDRLYVTGHTSKRPPKEPSWHDLIGTALKDLGSAEIEPDGRARLVYAEPQTAESPDGGAGGADEMVPEVTLPDWTQTPPVAEPTPPRPLSPSRPDAAEPPVRAPLAVDDGDRFKRGLMVHALLQTLPELPPRARRDACLRYLARPLHGLDAVAQEALADEVMAILDDPDIADIFGPGSRAEVPVAGCIDTRDGRRAISGQIDRLLVGPDRVLIVDYKTNRPPPTRPEDVPDVYLRQMATYRAALSTIFDDRPVRALLLWTDGPNWMEIPDNVLDPHAP